MLSMMAASPAGGSPENSMLSFMAVSAERKKGRKKEREGGREGIK
jgi:hypothetical protein